MLGTLRQSSMTPSDAVSSSTPLARDRALDIGIQPKKSEATTSKAKAGESMRQATRSENNSGEPTVQAPQSLDLNALPTQLPGDEQEQAQYYPCIVPMEQWSSMVANGAVPIAQVSQEQASQLASGSLSLETLLAGGHVSAPGPVSLLCGSHKDQLQQSQEGQHQISAGGSDDDLKPENCSIHDDSSTCSGVSSLNEFNASQSPISSPLEKACLGIQDETALPQQQGNFSQQRGCPQQSSSVLLVKNTFIDFDDGISKASRRRVRSWSPLSSFNISAEPLVLNQ